MRAADALSDVELLRLFQQASMRMSTPDALRHVIAEAEAAALRHCPTVVLAVVDEVGERYGTTRAALFGGRGSLDESRHRAICWWLLHHRFEISWTQLGRIFDGRDHTSVLKTTRSLADLIKINDTLRATVDDIERAAWARLAERKAA